MALARKIIGGIMVLIGGIWFLQGNNVLPGSFMTGSTFWAVVGGATLLAGGHRLIRVGSVLMGPARAEVAAFNRLSAVYPERTPCRLVV